VRLLLWLANDGTNGDTHPIADGNAHSSTDGDAHPEPDDHTHPGTDGDAHLGAGDAQLWWFDDEPSLRSSM